MFCSRSLCVLGVLGVWELRSEFAFLFLNWTCGDGRGVYDNLTSVRCFIGLGDW